MANYYSQARTNYFAVKDPQKFLKELEGWSVTVITKEQEDGTTLYGFLDDDPNGGGLSYSRYYYAEDDVNEENELVEEREWSVWLAGHLADDAVAILVEVGSEKYRYFNGYAFAVNSKNETRTVDLNSIYELAGELGNPEKITTAEF